MSNTGNTQQIIDYGATANDGTGDPLRTAFIKTDENFSNIWAAGPVGSNITIANNTIQNDSTNGNITLKPNGTGVIQANASILPNIDSVRDLGSNTRAWRRAYINIANISEMSVQSTLDVAGDATIQGNLTVEGDTIQIGNITTDTLLIQLANAAANGAQANGAGVTVGANDDIATILYNSSGNVWTTNIGISAAGNITAPYFIGNGSQLTGINQYGNSNVAAYLPTYTGNLAGSRLDISSGANSWTMQDANLGAPSGGQWRSDASTLDDYITSAANGYINLQSLYSNGNIASELHLEHGVAHIRVADGPFDDWYFRSGGNMEVPGDILPQANGVYSLGNSSLYWANLWVANNTIYIGGVPLGMTAGNVLTVNGEALLSNDSDTSITTTGNITANIITATESANLGSLNFYAATMSMADDLWNNISISPNVEGWAFVQIPKDSVANVDNLRLYNSAGNVELGSGDFSNDGPSYTWTFGTAGQTIPPVLNVARGDNPSGNISGYTLNLGDGSQEAIITTPDGGEGDPNSQRIVINPGKGADTTSGEGGDIYLWAGRGGDAGGSGGDVKIRGGQGMVNGAGGYIRMEGGDGQGVGQAGYITMDGGSAVDDSGGYLQFRGGYSQNNDGGYIEVRGGYSTNGEGGDVNIIGGGSDGGQGLYGNIGVQSGSRTWTFDNTGNLTAPGNISATGNVAGDVGFFNDVNINNVTTNKLLYANDDRNVYDTNFGYESATGNISGTGNITTTANVTAAYFIGDGSQLTGLPAQYGDSNVATFLAAYGSNTVSTTGNITAGNFLGLGTNVDIIAGSYDWTFDNAGTLTLPGNTFAVNYANGSAVSLGGNYGNANVVANLAALSSNPVSTTGNVTAGYFIGNGSQLTNVNAATLDITDTNGLTTVYYPTFVENRTTGQIARADQHLTYRTDTNMLTAGNITVTGTGTALNASSGNVLTNQVTGTQFNFLNGIYTASINGAGATANYTLQLPANTGTNGQVLTTNGSGALTWSTPAGTYGNANVVANLAALSSNPISTTGNITANNFIGNISITGNVTGTSANVTLVAGSYSWSFDNTGNLVLPGNTFSVNYANGTAVTLGGAGSYGNANVADFLDSLGSNAIITTGNITAGNLITSGAATTGVNALLAGPTFTPLANTSAGFVANVNSYSQITFQNRSTGADATADYILTADNGSDTVNYGDFGIINSGYDVNTPTNSLGNIVRAGDTYVYAQGNVSNTSQSGGNLILGTTTATKNVKIFAGGANNNALIANISNTGVAITGALSTTGNITANNITGSAANVTITANAYVTTFDTTGLVTFPGAVKLAVYANTTARDAAIPSPAPGMMIYVTGTGMQVRGATQWNTIAGSGT